jgi:hypothetical protein
MELCMEKIFGQGQYMPVQLFERGLFQLLASFLHKIHNFLPAALHGHVAAGTISDVHNTISNTADNNRRTAVATTSRGWPKTCTAWSCEDMGSGSQGT